jgi:multiple sugar transport system substrate-binding protein
MKPGNRPSLAPILVAISLCLALAQPLAGLAADKPYDGVELNFLMISNHKVGLESRLDEFEARTGIKVNLLPVSMPDLYSKLGVEFAAGGSAYDVVELMWAAAQGYARGGNLLPLDEMINAQGLDLDQYAGVYVDRHMIRYPQTPQGQVICLPHQADIQLLAYRKDLFEDPAEKAAFQGQYGYPLAPPETFDQFLEIARFFTRDTDGDGKNDLFGTTVMGKNFPSLVGDITPYIRGFGGDWIDAGFHPAVASKDTVKGIQFYVDLFARYKVTPPGAATYSWEDEIADFQHNKLAMMIIWPGQVVALENAEASQAAGKIGYAVVPGRAATVGGWAVALPKAGKHPQAAFAFIKWLTSTETALARARETGFSTAAQAVYEDPQMRSKYAYLDAFKTSLPYGRGWPQIGEFTSIWQIGAQELSRVFAGEIDIPKASQLMNQRLDQLMKDGGYY